MGASREMASGLGLEEANLPQKDMWGVHSRGWWTLSERPAPSGRSKPLPGRPGQELVSGLEGDGCHTARGLRHRHPLVRRGIVDTRAHSAPVGFWLWQLGTWGWSTCGARGRKKGRRVALGCQGQGERPGLAQELGESLAWSSLAPWKVKSPGGVTEKETAR